MRGCVPSHSTLTDCVSGNKNVDLFLVADFHVVGLHVFRSDVLAENTVSVGIAFDSNVAAKGATGENHKRSNERNGNLTISTSSLLTL